jgi:hypothetical protein
MNNILLMTIFRQKNCYQKGLKKSHECVNEDL